MKLFQIEFEVYQFFRLNIYAIDNCSPFKYDIASTILYCYDIKKQHTACSQKEL